MFAVVSTLDDHNGKFVRLFNTKDSAEKWALQYIKDNHGETWSELALVSDDEKMDYFIDYLEASEWFFVIECEDSSGKPFKAFWRR